MAFEIREASRSHAKPLVGLYSESGAGKTYTALLLARGFVGPAGRICMIETESGRGEAYADKNEYPEIGGYSVLSLRDDFSPKNYGEAIKQVEQGGFDALIIDSASHEWEGAGGVLDMASKNEAAGKKGMLIWQGPKIDHQKHFMLKFMQTPLSLVILCMRAKYPMTGSGSNLKRSEILEPKQSEDILYEMFVHGWIEKGSHNFKPTKITAKSLHEVFPDGRPITLDTGRRLAQWAKGQPTAAATPAATATPGATDTPDPLAKEKALANDIRAAIKEATDYQGLLDLWEIGYRSDIETVRSASQKAYDSLKEIFDLRITELGEN